MSQGTNKERLQQNNARLDELINLLISKEDNNIPPAGDGNGSGGLSGGAYNIKVINEEDGTTTLDITDWNYVTPLFRENFAKNSPAQIAYVSSEIVKNNYNSTQIKEIFGWDLQTDKIPITLTTGEKIEVRMIGYNHDTLSSDHTTKAGISFQMVDCLATLYPMHDADTNAGGYPASKLRTSTLATIYDTLPREWREVIKPVDKKSANGGGTNYTATVTTSDNIFLFSQIEIFATGDLAQDGANEGKVYEYWENKTATDRIKYYDKNGDGVVDTATRWHLRSVRDTLDDIYLSIINTGSAANSSPDSPYAISFGFCI